MEIAFGGKVKELVRDFWHVMIYLILPIKNVIKHLRNVLQTH